MRTPASLPRRAPLPYPARLPVTPKKSSITLPEDFGTDGQTLERFLRSAQEFLSRKHMDWLRQLRKEEERMGRLGGRSRFISRIPMALYSTAFVHGALKQHMGLRSKIVGGTEEAPLRIGGMRKNDGSWTDHWWLLRKQRIIDVCHGDLGVQIFVGDENDPKYRRNLSDKEIKIQMREPLRITGNWLREWGGP